MTAPFTSLPTAATAVPGQEVTGAFWNANERDPITFLQGVPMYFAVATSATSVGTTDGQVNLQTIVFDPYFGGAATTGTYTTKIGGWCWITAQLAFPASNTTEKDCWVQINSESSARNGQLYIAASSASITTVLGGSAPYFLNAGDTVKLMGKSVTTATNTGIGVAKPSLAMFWIHS